VLHSRRHAPGKSAKRVFAPGDPGIHVFFFNPRTWMAGTSPAMTQTFRIDLPRYCETVCTTLPIGRALEVGTFRSFSSASSYSGSVWKVVLAFICTIL
jgi:hypothetical protein